MLLLDMIGGAHYLVDLTALGRPQEFENKFDNALAGECGAASKDHAYHSMAASPHRRRGLGKGLGDACCAERSGLSVRGRSCQRIA